MNSNNWLNKVLHYFNLEDEIDDFDVIHQTINKDIVFKGTNLLVLIFATFIASVGLNMNSTAVIIGAMLISPLMGPINGMGYSIATYDSILFRKSLKNYLFAVLGGLVASTIYFKISPISTAHSELLARTSPTIYDVLIAFFGGMAGILAISSKQKGNVIPGVAIATALMPPLCTAGYGLSSGNLTFFFGALYLFTINTVFIGISSVVMSQILKFPIRTIVEENHKKKTNRWISIVITLCLLPSIYFGYNLVQKEKFIENSNNFINAISFFEGNYLLRNEINPSNKTINLTYAGAVLNPKQEERIKDIARSFSLSEDTKIEIKEGLSFDSKNTEIDKLRAEISNLKTLLQEKENQISAFEKNKQMGSQITKELASLYPQVKSVFYSNAYISIDKAGNKTQKHLFLVELNNMYLAEKDKDKISIFFKTRIESEDILIFYERKNSEDIK